MGCDGVTRRCWYVMERGSESLCSISSVPCAGVLSRCRAGGCTDRSLRVTRSGSAALTADWGLSQWLCFSWLLNTVGKSRTRLGG